MEYSLQFSLHPCQWVAITLNSFFVGNKILTSRDQERGSNEKLRDIIGN